MKEESTKDVFETQCWLYDADEWAHDLEEIVDCALSKNNRELGLEMVTIYSHLVKLTEAAHLINVREVTHIGGILKTRFIEN